MPVTTTPALDFEAAWEEFFAATRRARARSARDQPGGLSLAQLHLLSPLAGGESQTVGTLATSAGVAGPTATRMLDALERDGIVVRGRSVADRRVVTISLTEPGADLLAAKQRSLTVRRRRAFASLSDAEQEHAAALLRRLAEVVEAL